MTDMLQGSTLSTIAANGNLLGFGGRGGSFFPINDVGGQKLMFWSDENYIHAMQIGERLYGVVGGTRSAVWQIPADGKLTLIELQSYRANNYAAVLNYIRAKLGDHDIEAGNRNHAQAAILTLPDKFVVRFAGVGAGTKIDSLYFTVVTPA